VREYPAAPLVGVGAVVLDGGRVLLVQRGRPPALGRWSLPGGLVDVGERLEAAVRREVAEECGLTVEVHGLVGAVDRIVRDDEGRVRSHYVLFDRDGEEVARVDARLSAAVTRRRAGRVAVVAGAGLVGIPVIGAAGVAAVTSLAVTAAIRQLRDWVDPIDIASELRLSRDGEPLGVFVRRSLVGTVGPGTPPVPIPWGSSTSLYEIDLTADAARTVDRRLALAVPVAMDALRGVLADSPLR